MKRLVFIDILVIALYAFIACDKQPVDSGDESDSIPAEWWKSMGSVMRYMPGQDSLTAQQIASNLDNLKSDGFNVIHITAPYHSPGFTPWWGLRVTDYFDINRNLGSSMTDFKYLVDECHSRGIPIIAFINLNYGDPSSDIWVKAASDRSNGINSPESNYFLFSDINSGTPGANEYFGNDGSWIWSSEASSYYWSFWRREGLAEPSYNWGSQDWRDYAASVVTFWMDTGIDGLIIDAVHFMLNCDMSIMRTYVTDVINSYPNSLSIPEGGGAYNDDPVGWITQGGFNGIDHQGLVSDWARIGQSVNNALASGDPSPIEQALVDYHDRVQDAGGVLWNYPKWYIFDRNDPNYRLLEVATMLSTGQMLDWRNEYTSRFPGWGESQIDDLHAIMYAGSHNPALNPWGTRTKLSTNNDNAYYAFKRSNGEQDVLVVLNYQKSSQNITVNLSNSGISTGQTPLELFTNTSGPTISSNSYTVTLPALGYAAYEVGGGTP
jgi:glycosidase